MDMKQFLEFGKGLVEIGEKQGVTLRLLGHLAVRQHITRHIELLDHLERIPTHDVDFMGYSKEQNEADRMFIELGYEPDPSVAYSQEYGIKRLIYHHRKTKVMAEIFFDQLPMSHTINFLGRLELDYPTISLVDLFLSKLQIQEINEKDIKDLIVLLAEHDFGPGDRDLIDIDYFLKIMSDDWGFCHTATTNLGKLKDWVGRYDVISDEVRESVEVKLADLLSRMENEPKSLRWKLRAKIGTRVKWYQDVSEVQNIHQ
ncbi:MAG: hypothetical protein WBB69_14360 [Anaerolineales bacterium]